MKDRSLKDEMRAAVQGDRERAEARRKAEEEGGYTVPAPPTLDLNKPTREWKLPEKEEVVAPEDESELDADHEPQAEPESEIELESAQEPEPEVPSRGIIERLRAFFRG